jgi:predicted porin
MHSKITHTLRAAAIAAAVASSFAAQAADESVTIYGVADVYLQVAKGDRSEVSLQSGGLSGSRLGFKGSRDVGDGLKGLFQFEAGLAVDQGVSTQGGRLFGRQALVGLSGDWGTLTAGRQYLPHFNAVDNFDPFSTGAGSGASSGIVSLLAARADNSLVYGAPRMGPVSVSVMAALAETGTSNSNGNLYSADVQFVQGGLDLGVSFAQRAKQAAGDVSSSIVLLAGSYDAGAVKVMGGVQSVKDGTGAPATEDDRTEFFVGAQVPVGAKDAFWAGAYTGKTKSVSGSTATQISLGWDHTLGKGLDAYAVASVIRNGDATAFTTDSATGAGPAVSPGTDVKGVQVGVRYRF